jgi:hypothetical protein
MLEALISKQFKYPPLLEGELEEQALAHEVRRNVLEALLQ